MIPRIIATGSAVPEKIVTNDDLSRHMDTSDEWIRTRTGIRERRISEEAPEQKLFSLSREAAERAIAMAQEEFGAEFSARTGQQGFSREDIELVIVATCTPDMAFPATACRLQDALQLGPAAAFDLSLACTGFVAALNTAAAFIQCGRYRTVLIVGADVMSRMIDWSDRNSAVLFGDGAGAAILSGDPRFSREGSGFLDLVMHADGSGTEALKCRAMYFNEAEPAREYMDGRRVFEFAVKKVPEVIREVLARNEKEPSDISLYVLHQANYRILESVAKRLSEPMEKFPHNIESYGNTTAGSIPILLDELNRSGRLEAGDLLCLAGFGGGLSYAAALLWW